LLSPFLLIAIGQLAAFIMGPTVGTWAWVYLFMGYWLSLATLILWGGGKKAIARWLLPSQGGAFWPIVAMTFSLVTTLWIAFPNWRLLFRPDLFFATIVFALINACLEEGYWRGLIMDAAAKWPGWLAILYSGGLSAINHLFVMVIVVAARNPAVWVYQLIVGVLMGIVYRNTKSLRWPITSHAVINILSLPVAMFLNLIVPGPPG
jgi:membrane protease YdiL (CAAX protease family)